MPSSLNCSNFPKHTFSCACSRTISTTLYWSTFNEKYEQSSMKFRDTLDMFVNKKSKRDKVCLINTFMEFMQKKVHSNQCLSMKSLHEARNDTHWVSYRKEIFKRVAKKGLIMTWLMLIGNRYPCGLPWTLETGFRRLSCLHFQYK